MSRSFTISARTCDKQKEKELECPPVELEFYLEETSNVVYLKVMDKTNGYNSGNIILNICKKTGKISRHHHVSNKYRLPLDKYGRLKIKGEE